MRLALTERRLPGDRPHRTVEPSDASALGELLLAAYRGTVDDEGESKEDADAEVERVFADEYGPLLRDASFVVLDGERLVGASLVASSESRPLLLYLVVHPNEQRRGLGTFLVTRSANALVAAGHSELDLFVTEANDPAVTLYRKLGFVIAERVAGPDAH
jgi:ribosomal protein S18 acetylase RimI-like enzyme